MPNPTASMQVTDAGVAIVTLENPPVNALHPAGEQYVQLTIQDLLLRHLTSRLRASQSCAAYSPTYGKLMPPPK